MRCPKCHYLSFDPEPRCKNCGYDLEVADAELAFKAAEDYSDPVADLELRRAEPKDLAPVSLELRRDEPGVERVPAARIRKPAARRAAVIANDADDIWPARSAPAVAAEERPAPVREPRFRADADEDDAWPARATPEPVAVTPAAPARENMFRIEPVRESIARPEQETEVEPVGRIEPVRRVEPEPAQEPEPGSPRASCLRRLCVRRCRPSLLCHRCLRIPRRNCPCSYVSRQRRPGRRCLFDARSLSRRVCAPVDSGMRPATKDLRVGPLDRDLLDDLRRVEREEAAYAAVQARVRANTDAGAGAGGELDDDPEDIPATQRLAAGALDGVLMGAIGSVALWATLRVTGASITSFGTDAIVAFLVFVGGVSVAYLLMFTAAGGQTVGKMLMGLRVVGDTVDSIDDQLTMAQAALRAVLAPLSVLALGLGWLPALFGRGLALHDRLAHTRVVRV